ncbi:MAG: HAMP domain-containing sensor histidine kinase [Eubacteriales bacterium]|nr:HAMP domain-containing sensor histidine kinase [Eubacteriales bacterium]
MDIKLKKYNAKTGATVLAFILCIVLFLASLTGIAVIFHKASSLNLWADADDLLFSDSYQNSRIFKRDISEKADSIIYSLREYKGEEAIRNGETISQERLDQEIGSLFYNYLDRGANYNNYEKYGNDISVPGIKEAFVKDHADEIAQIKERMIMDDLRYFRENVKMLSKDQGFTYFASDGTNVITNIKDIGDGTYVKAENFSGKPAYLIYQNDELNTKLSSNAIESQNDNVFIKQLKDRIDREYNPALRIYLSFDQKYLSDHEAVFDTAKSELFKWLPLTIICVILTIAALIYLLITTGRRDEEGNRQIYKIDKLFTEIHLAVVALSFFGGGALFSMFLFDAARMLNLNETIYRYGGSFILSLTIAAAIGLISAGIGLLFILSIVRNLKAGQFIKNSLIYILITAIFKGSMSLYHGGSLMKKVVLITLAVCILSATVFLAPVMAVIIIVLAPKWVKKYEAVKKGVDEVKSGNLTYKIPLSGSGELEQLAEGINEISEASNIAIQNELKNQRLKTDLISNVSHDLKTPLTSIITYIDLLKQEGLDSPDAPKYLDILDQKSIRLKKLTEDLFDAAKASSGAIPVRFEKVEMLSLINQGLGEMNDRIEASNLEFRINAQKDKYFVCADGQLLWRVVENLLNNVLKYAQEGSRVYIDLKEQNGKNDSAPYVIMEMKNISKSELNIDADELMERFKRGDESRATEGSGLGLAIAKDLIRLQKGWFEIKIDGDLFKAIVMLEAYSENPETPAD